MDWLQFFAAIVTAIAWPLVVLVVLFMLRRPLHNLVPFLEELRYKDFVLKFRAGLSEVRASTSLQPVPVPVPEATSPPEPFQDELETLYGVAKLAPTAAVIQAWATLEDAIVERVVHSGKAAANTVLRGNSRLGHVLFADGVFTKSDFDAFHKLRELRNIAAHKADAGLTEADAREYVELAMKLYARVKG
jgi:hypothetical protein